MKRESFIPSGDELFDLQQQEGIPSRAPKRHSRDIPPPSPEASQPTFIQERLGEWVKVFQSRSNGAGRRPREPRSVVLAVDAQDCGFRQVRMEEIDANLDYAAHHTLSHIPEDQRYDAAREDVERRIRDLQVSTGLRYKTRRIPF